MKRWSLIGLILVFALPAPSQVRVLWDVPAGWSNPEEWNTLDQAAVDHEGHLFLGGGFRSMDRWADVAYLTTKYDTRGELLWGHIYNGPVTDGWDYITDLGVDSQGNVIVTGTVYGAGIGTLKYAPDGTLLWERFINQQVFPNHGSFTPTISKGLVVDAQDNVVVAGTMYGYTSPVGQKLLVVKYDPAGNLLWARAYRRPTQELDTFGYVREVALDRQGNIRVVGVLGNTSFGRIPVLLKYSPEGELLWAQASYNFTELTGELIDAQGNTYLLGYEVIREGYLSHFVLKYDSQGNLLWRGEFNVSPSYPYTFYMGMAVSEEGEVYVSDYVSGYGFALMQLSSVDGSVLWRQPIVVPREWNALVGVGWFDQRGNLYGWGIGTRGEGDRNVRLVMVKFDRMGRQLWAWRSPVWLSSFWAGFTVVRDRWGKFYFASRERIIKFELVATRWEGDVNGDECVSDLDLARVLIGFGGSDVSLDVNGDGIVDEVDVRIVLENFGLGCGE